MPYTPEEVATALSAYAQRPRTRQGRAADFATTGPGALAGIRSIELVAVPHLNAPVRGISLYPMEGAFHTSLLQDLLPILTTAACSTGSSPAPAAAASWSGTDDEVLDRVGDPQRNDADLWPEIRSWMRRIHYAIEAYTNAPRPSVSLALEDPALDAVRPRLQALLASDLRSRTREALLQGLADGQFS